MHKEKHMQITIVQVEIEQALREYVGRQLRVAEGNHMIIKLSATRGADGMMATIDIQPIPVHSGSNSANAGPHSTQTAFTPIAPVIKPTLFGGTRAAPQTQAPIEEAAGKGSEDTGEEEPATQGDEDVTYQEPSAVTEPLPETASAAAQEAPKTEATPEAGAKPHGRGRSLFGGMKKPAN
jgi:hypothetical protein